MTYRDSRHASKCELDTILAKIERVLPRANGRPDLRLLSAAERERVTELAERITVDVAPR